MTPEIVAFVLVAIGVLLVVVVGPALPRGNGIAVTLGVFAIFYGGLWIGRQEDALQWLVNILTIPAIDTV